MGNDEPVTPSKSDKASSPVQEQPVVHPYPDWAAMQAYYSSGVPMPLPYFNSAIVPGHPPHPYTWGPQPVMPPFAMPYTAIYPHGVYPHPPMVSPLTTEVSVKSSESKGGGSLKKPKGFDGLAASIGNINADGSGQSHSRENGSEGSSNANDDNNELGGKENQRKRSSEDTPSSDDSKAGLLTTATATATATATVSKGVTMSPSKINCNPLYTLPPSTQLKAGACPELWNQDERELRREKRKQSNRESARRSRLRKQAETEELAVKVETLIVENTSLRSEITRFKEKSEKMRAENSSLMAKLKNAEEDSLGEVENREIPSVVAENFLSRIDEPRQEELRQLLDSNPRSDPVVAG